MKEILACFASAQFQIYGWIINIHWEDRLEWKTPQIIVLVAVTSIILNCRFGNKRGRKRQNKKKRKQDEE